MWMRHLPATLLLLLSSCLQATNASTSKSFLSESLVKKNQVQSVLEHEPAKAPSCHEPPTGPIETTLCDYETVESLNDDLFSNLSDLVKTPFFKYFRVDLYRECPFWHENGLCMNRECSITTVDESEIPEKWRAAALSEVEMPSEDQRKTMPGCYYRDCDFCYLDDMTEGDYVDLSRNPERFTGYIGPSAHRVWNAIYQENCFGIPEINSPTGKTRTHDSFTDPLPQDELESGGGQCLEKKVYYKIISGLHASITTHICAEYFNQTTGEWGPNLDCFANRVAAHPERLQYIYFNTVLLLRAVSRIGPYLSEYDYCSSGTHEEDLETLTKLGKVIDIAQTVGKFDESVLFQGEDADILKDEFKAHFRNVTRIMDCVGCDKCRLWGKVQTTGVATALKILFELDEAALDPKSNLNLLSRSEVVALVTTLYRFSESLHAVNDFRRIWAETNSADASRLIEEVEKATTPSRQPRPSPLAGASKSPETFVDQVRSRLACWLRACKEGTADCVNVVVDVVRSVVKTVESLFGLSGKSGLRGEL